MIDQKLVVETIRQIDRYAKEILRRCGYCRDYAKRGDEGSLQLELGCIKTAAAELEKHRDKISVRIRKGGAA